VPHDVVIICQQDTHAGWFPLGAGVAAGSTRLPAYSPAAALRIGQNPIGGDARATRRAMNALACRIDL